MRCDHIDLHCHLNLADVKKTGGSEHNSPHHSGQDGSRKEEYGPKCKSINADLQRPEERLSSSASQLITTRLSVLQRPMDLAILTCSVLR